MIYNKNLWFVLIIAVCCLNCAPSIKLNRGTVKPLKFYAKTSFTTAKSLILIQCELEGRTKNFIFDTGAQVTALQRDSIFGDIIKVRGGSNRVVTNGSEIIKSLKIKGVDFVNTFATNENMIGIKEQIPNFGGILGRSVINKANWLIDYPQKILEFSNEDLSDESFTDINLISSESAPVTIIRIENNEYNAIIDLGSTSIFNIPKDTDLANELLIKYEFKENIRKRYTVGGTEIITELLGTIPLLKIGSLEFENVLVNINQSSQIRLGIEFFKDYLIYINNVNNILRIKKIR